MLKHNQDGAASGAVIALFFTVLLLIGAIVFGVWSFTSRQDYKDNSDAKVSDAVDIAKKQTADQKAKEYAEQAKSPVRTYNGPEAYGSLVIKYPKTWSGYVDTKGSGTTAVDGYFYPAIVPSITDPNSTFALRVQVSSSSYADVLRSYQGQQKNNDPKRVPIKIKAYALPKVPKVVGVRVTGTSSDKDNKLVDLVILPLRFQTLEIWTEGSQFSSDFNKYILPNFSFSP